MQPDVEALTDTDAANVPIQAYQPSLDALRTALAREIDDRRRAECALRIQSDAVQLALQLLVREPDVTGFFRAFIKALVDESESHACGVWLLNADRHAAICGWRTSAAASTPKTATDWDTLTLPRSSLATHLVDYPRGWTATIEYTGDDPRLPAPVHDFNRAVRCRVAGHCAALAADSQSRLGGARDRARLRLRERVASSAARSHGAAGDAGAAPQSPGRTESRRGAAAGRARRAQPDGARHSRHAGPGIRRHPDAAAGGTAIGARPCRRRLRRASRPPSISRART